MEAAGEGIPKGALCKFDSRFELGISADTVYNISPNDPNKCVFKKS